jgi:response regulator of citrate/malate metabolism
MSEEQFRVLMIEDSPTHQQVLSYLGVYDYILKPYNKASRLQRLAATFERLKKI